MAYTAPTSARIWNTPMGGTVHCMDPHIHKVDNHGAQGYKTNQEGVFDEYSSWLILARWLILQQGFILSCRWSIGWPLLMGAISMITFGSRQWLLHVTWMKTGEEIFGVVQTRISCGGWFDVASWIIPRKTTTGNQPLTWNPWQWWHPVTLSSLTSQRHKVRRSTCGKLHRGADGGSQGLTVIHTTDGRGDGGPTGYS